ncbi:MAG TPA: SHOCT domain-containing protein [Candidatus Binatia bacterium]|jgi:putative membrane protein
MERLAKPLIGVLTGWLIPMAALAQERSYEWGWGMHPMWWGAWGFGMMLLMLLFWVLVIVGLVIGIRWLLGQGKESRSDSALEILRQRYARGEINKEEFEAKRKDLGG